MEAKFIFDAHNSVPTGGNTYATTYDRSKHDHSNNHHDNIYNTHHHYAIDDRSRTSKRPQDRLEEYVSKGAAHDSAERGTDAPRCFPETREAVQGEVLSFVDPGGDGKVLWLTGPAGGGKTAIMGSIADECHARGWLAGSFFFSSSANKVDRCSKRYLIPTLAYHFFQLNIPGLPTAILASIEANPSVFDKRLDQQVEILLLRPLRKVLHEVDPSGWPKVVVVDGVDECTGDEGQQFKGEHESRKSREGDHKEILSALTQASQDPAFPFCVIIASRPERAIQEHMSSPRAVMLSKIVLDYKYSPEADIELYARAMLTKIGRDFGLPEGWYNQVVPADWPEHCSRDMPRYFAEEASGQFIYVATVIRYIQDSSHHPYQQLERVLNWRGEDTSHPFAALDALYTGILRTSPKPFSAALFFHAFSWVRDLGAGDGWFSRAVLESSPGEVEYLMGTLTSLICIVDDNGEPDFRPYHKTLFDFFFDSKRSGDLGYWRNSDHVWDLLWNRLYETLKNRGPLVPLLRQDRATQFYDGFCGHFVSKFPLNAKYQYTTDDVDWWLSTPERDMHGSVIFAFSEVHTKCHWYTCQPVCRVWRKRILFYARANRWRVPTMLEMLQDRIRPFHPFPRDSRGTSIHNILRPPGCKCKYP